MLGALIIVFREVIEAGLIVGIVMAATRGVPDRSRWIMIGIGAGVLGAAIVAMFAGVISEAFQGAGQELFNASVLGVAVIMLMWHNAWMARHGREIAAEMRRVGHSCKRRRQTSDGTGHRRWDWRCCAKDRKWYCSFMGSWPQERPAQRLWSAACSELPPARHSAP